MPANEMFASQLRSLGDLAGVFEFDGETAYFYLYNTKEPEGKKIIRSVHVLSGIPDFEEQDIAIQWDHSETKVGLQIQGKLWAAFDVNTRAVYGGNYHVDGLPQIPSWIAKYFQFPSRPN